MSGGNWYGMDKGAVAGIFVEPFGVALLAHGLGLSSGRSIGLAALVVVFNFAVSIAAAGALGKFAGVVEAQRRSVLWGGDPPKPTRVRRIGRVRIGRSWRTP